MPTPPPATAPSAPDIHDYISEIEYAHVPVASMYGIDVPTGWYPIITDVHEQMLHVDPYYTFLACSEQSGQLRIDIDTAQEADKEKAETTQAIMDNAKAYCAKTCMVCSEAGEFHEYLSWCGVLCPHHWEQRQG